MNVAAAVETTTRQEGGGKNKYAYIDALRGYAILLVITCHTGQMFKELPYPLKQLTNFGWHGVQLFFLASCVTLMMSWHSETRKNGRASAGAFFVRRFFRIAPMYYLAGLFYFLIEPPAQGFDFWQMVASAAFVNAWHPLLTPTVGDGWTVVPGGWSIGVEFSFYLLFPVMVTLVVTMRRAVAFFILALIFGSVANVIAARAWTPIYGQTGVDNFLFFWLPNQISIFAMGTILYFLLPQSPHSIGSRFRGFLSRHQNVIIAGCFMGLVATAYSSLPGRLPLTLPYLFPKLIVASALFMVGALVMAVNRDSFLINKPIRSLGTVSFSAYLLHFAILHKLPVYFPGIFDLEAVGLSAMFACLLLWVVTVPLCYALSLATFTLIETPMINLGRSLLRSLNANDAAGTVQARAASRAATLD